METKNFWSDLKKVSLLATLIIILIGWGVTWGVFKTKVEMQETQLQENKAEIKELKTENTLMYKELKANVEENTKGLAIVGNILGI